MFNRALDHIEKYPMKFKGITSNAYMDPDCRNFGGKEWVGGARHYGNKKCMYIADGTFLLKNKMIYLR